MPAFLGAMKPSLDVGLVVSSEDKTKEFYGGVLGLKEVAPLTLPDGGKMLRFQYGSTTIKALLYSPTPAKNPGGINAAIGLRLLTLTMPDLELIQQNAVAKGLTKPAILGKDRGMRLIFIYDPDGNQLEILESAPGGDASASDRAMVGLTVKNIEKSREFYGKILGLKELPSRSLFPGGGPTKYSFVAGKSVIKFWTFDKDLPIQTGKWSDAVGIRYFTFLVKDVDAVQAELEKRGVKPAIPASDFGTLARVMFLADPDGNYIEFASLVKKK